MSSNRHECWLCLMQFPTHRELKNHVMANPHLVLQVICPLGQDERQLRRMVDLNHHMKKEHPQEHKSLSTDFFSEANGYWLCTKPEDYKRVVKPNYPSSATAISARVMVLNYFKTAKQTSRSQQEWVRQWRMMFVVNCPPGSWRTSRAVRMNETWRILALGFWRCVSLSFEAFSLAKLPLIFLSIPA